jgi:hypothetical protein
MPLLPIQPHLSQGFGLTIGSDFYLVIDRRARRAYYRSSIPENLNYTHGHFIMANGTERLVPIAGVLGLGHPGHTADHIAKGEHRLHPFSHLSGVGAKYTVSARLYPRFQLAMVETGIALVDIVFSCSYLLHLFFPLEPAILEKPSIAHHGPIFLLCLCCEPCSEYRLAWKD